MKNKIFSILLSVMLLLPAAVWAVDNVPEQIDETTVIEEVQPQMLDEDAQAEEDKVIVKETQTPYKQPFGKKDLIKKFLLAMFAVVISSFVLYIGLTLYNRVRDGFEAPVKTPDGETTLQTPDDIEGAVRTFLEKTKW